MTTSKQANRKLDGVSTWLAVCTAAVVFSSAPVTGEPVSTRPSMSVTEPMLKALKARSIGPAVMGGRVSDIAIDPANPYTFYVGLATGGVWKTTNNGVAFQPVFDDQQVLSIGAVAVAPSAPHIVWVGSGEGNDRNSSGWGDGVYKSTDAGETWQHMGLPESRAIRHVVIHPTQPDIVYVAAAGSLWAPGGERGLYKTADGGQTWKLILSALEPHNGLTGCSDIVMDPHNPDVLYAALYARQRRPWGFYYGANATAGDDAGGIFRSLDAGATWTKLSGGLPSLTGRIGLAIARSTPGVVMAVVQSDEGGTSDIDENTSRRGGIFRTENGGDTWTRVNALNPRPFYFSKIEIDPANDRRVYVLGWLVFVSDDGGRTFREDAFGKVHADVHALAIQPGTTPPPSATRPVGEPPPPPMCQRLLMGTDGGVYQSFDAGHNWDFLNRIPAGQFYRIELDDSVPYRVAGGLQDNCNWVGPSRSYTKEGVRNADWTMIGGGDGFYCVFDPDDPGIIYDESQGGRVERFNARTGEMRPFAPNPTEGQPRFRFHWNSPLIGSRHHRGRMYLGGNRIFRLTSRAEQFEVISPDLSHNHPDKTTTVGSAAENYAVVYSLAESPVQADLLYAGTDDGRLWYTRDEGRQWIELTETMPAEARGKWVARIEPSHFDAGSAYVVFSAYRDGDDASYAYRMTGFGKAWTRLSGDFTNGRPDRPARLPNPAVLIREDPVNRHLLYAGTEFGVFVSVDGGGHWVNLGGLPPVRVDDLKIHPREGDLVIGTHGRSIYILDDTSPLRELSPEVTAAQAHLFSIRPVHGRYLLPGWEDAAGKGWFKGENPPEGALITAWFREFTGERFKVTITNPHGRPVANFEQTATPGLTRLNWDLRVGKDFRTEYGGDKADRLVPSGEYTVELSYRDLKIKRKFAVTVEEGLAVHGTFRE